MVPEEEMVELEKVENVLGGGTRRRRIPRKRMMRGGINVQGVNPFAAFHKENPVYTGEEEEECGFSAEDAPPGTSEEDINKYYSKEYRGGTRRRRIPRKRTSKCGGKKSKRGGKKSKRMGKKTRRMRMRGGDMKEAIISGIKKAFLDSERKAQYIETVKEMQAECKADPSDDENCDLILSTIAAECNKDENKDNAVCLNTEGEASSMVSGGRRKKSKRGGKKKSKKTRRMRK